jgi:23S rRNA (uracil1939-C5)-methyltransferase
METTQQPPQADLPFNNPVINQNVQPSTDHSNAPTTVSIDKLVYGGDGLARLESGEVIFVPWSAPGDELKIDPQPGKPLRGKILEIQQPSPERTEPNCSVFGRCGGCNWQHISGEAQRDWKTRIASESLQRIGKFPEVNVLPTLGKDETAWAYRNRAQWDVDSRNPRQIKLGYHAAQSSEIVEFDHCHIIPDTLNAVALQIRTLLRENPGLAQGLKRIEAIRTQGGQLLLILESLNRAAAQSLATTLSQQLTELIGVSYRNAAKPKAPLVTLSGQAYVRETLGGQTYQISAGSFFQTNLHGAGQLLNVLDEALLPDATSLLDLYAGVGVFAMHFSKRVSRVLAIESAPTAIADARENLRLNGIDNVELRRGDARLVFKELKDHFDAAIVDPPRAGCTPEVLDWLSQHVHKQLLYVSCNPTTLARDLKALAAAGWRVDTVQPIDMFPQTYHIECVAKLSRA